MIEIKRKTIYFFTTTNTLSENKLEITNKTTRTLTCKFVIKPRNQQYKSFEDESYTHFNIMEKKCQILDNDTKTIPMSFIYRIEGLYSAVVQITVNKIATYEVELFGYVHTPDAHIEERRMIDVHLNKISMDNFFHEIIEDVIDDVKTSPPPLPDYSNDSDLRELDFNIINYNGGYEYNSRLYHELKELRKRLLNGEEQYWDLNLQCLKDLVAKASLNPLSKQVAWDINWFYCLLHYLRCFTPQNHILTASLRVS